MTELIYNKNESSFVKAISCLAIIALVLLWTISIFFYTKLPQIIPTHFNFQGKPDDYGNKNTLLVLPIIGTFVFVLFSFLQNRPKVLNYPIKITEANAEKQFEIAKRLLTVLKLNIQVLFSFILFMVYFQTYQPNLSIGIWVLPLLFLLILFPVFYFIVQSFSKKNNI